ncbi:MAG TPA: hypothetical protein VIV60_19255, partial [Polyangiaceae bacterium]
THRDYRVAATIQVIRFRDRIEVRNPGYSLVPEESFGEPGSAASRADGGGGNLVANASQQPNAP